MVDKAPNFSFPTKHILPVPVLTEECPWSPLTNQLSFTWRSNFGTDLKFIEVMNRVVAETSFLQAEIERTKGSLWKDSMFMFHHINPLIHSLLSLSKTDLSLPSSYMAEALRLAIILYLIAIRQKFALRTARGTLQLHKIKALFEKWELCQTLFERLGLGWVQIWILAIGAMMSKGCDNHDWFLARLHTSMDGAYLDRQKLETYDDLEDFMKGFLWVPTVHGPLLRALGDDIIT
jgi:hypothetical protein